MYVLLIVTPFREQLMSQQIIARMLKQDVVVNIELDSDANRSRFLYERGCPSDCFSLIVDGRVKIHIGNEYFVFEGGPFMYFGLQALTGTIQGLSGILRNMHHLEMSRIRDDKVDNIMFILT